MFARAATTRLLVLTALVGVAWATYISPSSLPGSRKPTSVYTSLVPFLRCQVCEAAVADACAQARALHALHVSYKEPEDRFLDITERLCDPSFPAGRWLQWLEIEAAERAFALVRRDYLGECGKSCRTMRQICRHVVDERADQLGTQLWRSVPTDTSAGELSQQICGSVCARQREPPAATLAEYTVAPVMPADEYNVAMRDRLMAASVDGVALNVITDDDLDEGSWEQNA